MAAVTLPPVHTLFSRVRLATAADIPNIHRLIHQLAVYEHLTHEFEATAAALSATLFPAAAPPPFASFTTLLLELSTSPFTPSHDPHFTPLLTSFNLELPVDDGEEEIFRCGGGATVGGFVLFFPKYSTILAKPGFYIQNIFVRECYRRRGMGSLLLAAVAARAAEMGGRRVEWVVAEWNVDAIKFYERLGAEILPARSLCRLTGEALRAYAHRA
ncbi:GCN5-related N-acetyltransferase 8-like [Salvia miltiorrhiza]|uniref:GCN5-related N-acetyltransferase 8-like n=1 Tax=Salvia miltiorrhiza TaxID=226208 RepID=UPI0025AC0247|nr:GCN5-related N-acetyltransferase 8-like [Salvia miltiorrhiza]